MVRFSSSSVAAIDSQTPFSTSGTSISRLGIGFLAVRLWSGNLFYPIRREMSSMRTTPVSSSEASYASTCAAGGYAIDLADLALPPAGSLNAFISPDLSSNGITKSGYVFTLAKNAKPGTVDVVLATCNAAGATRASSFFASAVPLIVGQTGTRFFATDTPGTIFVDLAAPIANPIPLGTATLQQ